MNLAAKHIIHNQLLEIRFSDFTTAHNWEDDKQIKTAEAVRKSVEQCFEAYDSAKDYLTIDRLELDLGAFSNEQFLSKMPEKLFHELQKILSSYRMDLLDFDEAEIIEDDSSINTWTGADNSNVSPIVKNSVVSAFLIFLQHGYLPWWYSNEPAWDPDWVKELSGKNLQELRDFLTANEGNEINYERALVRLISQFSDRFLAGLLKVLQQKEPVEKAWSWLTRFYDVLQKAEASFSRNESTLPLFSDFRLRFWKKWISYTVGRSAIPELVTFFALVKQPSLIANFLSEVAENDEWIDSLPQFWHCEFKSIIQKEHDSNPGISESRKFINHAESEKFKEPNKETHTDITSFTDNISYKDQASYTEKAVYKKESSHLDKEDFILIPDAGLVLLHPFLERLFDQLHWLDENIFINDEARNRAVYLLHYLAAGNEVAPEYVLVLPKLLCGIPPERLLEPALPLSEAEKAGCDELLKQVIAHWTAIQNTSPAGLRESFLWREAKLYSKDEGWHLEVPGKTEDILLNRLPWGFSMIKFPWMPLPISVSWE